MKNTSYILALAFMLLSCTGFLDERPSKAIDTPGSLESLQSMLDYGTMNFSAGMNIMLADEYFTDDAGFLSFTPWHQNLYLWKADPFELEDQIFEWRTCYNQIQISNLVLEALEKNEEKRSDIANQIKGTALFYRANAYYNLYSLYMEGPNLESKGLTPKIPVRNSTSITLSPELAGTEEIKAVIRGDLEEADRLMAGDPEYLTRPSLKAVKALKARIYLSWGDYDNALIASRETMALGLVLEDYSVYDHSITYPIEEFNKETIWYVRSGSSFSSQSGFQVDDDLYALYDTSDLRRDLFFITRPAGYVNFRGSYTGGITHFTGLASDEVYLTYSECLIRTGELEQAEQVLNELLSKRHSDEFIPEEFLDESQALKIIIEERRKELPFRGLRWTDLRRLNAEDRFRETLKRTYEGQEYSLSPESDQYILPIPARELSFY
ncbi:RagB/SusD family nutrient uptake outer membrane protein [uncultured Algoriphagus sp.]|uniref:RagB/SusD family nutrient uptake outer membrane protein n=1 Tax=uncultured Algoriphagus sp. TaxID=417365 RepID=UPI0030EE4DB2|tara:strand:- start:4409 stop:5722 length:1314 start_codon:yes stop_codon:yes gene_type:complete